MMEYEIKNRNFISGHLLGFTHLNNFCMVFRKNIFFSGPFEGHGQLRKKHFFGKPGAWLFNRVNPDL
ncbi:MAG: hypothetical protein Athens101428_128 [Candidatus Berkelbacteria bacterium Athens1014_28]|uniref:Uncharacterized protein n=1 Tax=Candidatus Berkelbacteria bacterium Athens1014_28 TaxID=2017145 RepID=A0A554LPN8_9BACT|nr:MAG: hypothetical protein Athens101428_128 [Candidatus Berkelbacteria bacterium Athens1014_28]